MDLKNWKLDVDAEHLAWLWFDRAGSTTNTFSKEALRELGQVADHLKSMPPKGLAILSAKDNGFAAGADIDEFTSLKDADEAIAFTVLATRSSTRSPHFPSRRCASSTASAWAGAWSWHSRASTA